MALRCLCPVVGALLGAATLVACSAGGGSAAPDGSGGPSSSPPPSATNEGTLPPDLGGLGGGTETPLAPIDLGPTVPNTTVCNQVQISFEPQTPTVMILLDRSSSMFEQRVGTTTLWATVRQAIYDVIGPLQSEVRFGFVSYTGLQDGTVPPSGLPTPNIPPTTTSASCPLFSPATPLMPALDSLAAIQPIYDALLDPVASDGMKGETPTGIAYQQTVQQLLAFPEPGSKFVILITDGAPDFCDESQCAEDHAVASVQEAFASGIRTIVFGLGVATTAHLQDLANAGAGLPVAFPPLTKLFCGGDTGNPEDTRTRLLGSYAAVGATVANAPFYFSTNADALTTELGAQLAGVKSCVFDLAGQIAIDINQGGDGTVKLCNSTTCDAAATGNALAFGDADGWRLNTSTQLELTGAGCSALQDQATQGLFIDFPCAAIIIR